MVKVGTVFFASDDSDVSVIEARAYIKRMGFTKYDVRLVRRDDMVLVVGKRELWL